MSQRSGSWITLCAGFVLHPAVAVASDAPLAGDWVAYPQLGGQRGSFVLHLTAAGERDALTAAISMPPIEVWRLPVGEARRDADGLLLGSARFAYDSESDTLYGALPEAIVPVHTIEVTLRRTEFPPAPAEPRDYGRQVDAAWTYATSAPIYAGIAAGDGRVYAGSDDGHVYALDAGSGTLIWKSAAFGPIRARPTLQGGLLFVHSDDAHLYCLDAATGAALWRTALADAPEPRTQPEARDFRYDHYGSAVTVSGGRLYVGTLHGQMLALDAAGGNIVWRFNAGEAVQSTPRVADGRVFFGSFDGHVYALATADGRMLWKHDTGAPVVSAPAVSGGLVIAGSRSYDLIALDAATGKRRWRYYYWFSWVESPATVVGGVVYVGSSDAGHVLALDAGSGRQRWRFDTTGSAWAAPAVRNGVVFAGAVGVRDYITDHRPGFFAVAASDGSPLWSYLPEPLENATFSGFASGAVADDRHVYVGGLDGRLYAFALAPR